MIANIVKSIDTTNFKCYHPFMNKKAEVVETMSVSLTNIIAHYLRTRAELEERSVSTIVKRIVRAEMERAPLPETKIPHKV